MPISVSDRNPDDAETDVSIDSSVALTISEYSTRQYMHIPITSGGLTLGDPTTFDGLTRCTWSIWVHNPLWSDAEPFLFKVNTGGAQNSFFIGSGAPNGVVVRIGSSGGPNVHAIWGSSIGLDVNAWNHVVVVFNGNLTGDANRLRVYLNGVYDAGTFSGGGDPVPAALDAATSSILTLGGVLNGFGASNLDLDEVGVWPGIAATAGQVLELRPNDLPGDPFATTLGDPSNFLPLEGDATDIGTAPWTATEFFVTYPISSLYEDLADNFTVSLGPDGEVVDAIVGGVFQPGFSGTVTQDPDTHYIYDVVINHDEDFEYNTEIFVNVGHDSEEPDDEYSFTTENIEIIESGKDGGGPFTVTSPVMDPGVYTMYIGPLGSILDPPAYNGHPGSANPNFLTFVDIGGGSVQATNVYFPPMELGDNFATLVPEAGGDPVDSSILVRVYPATFRNRVLLFRRILPPWYATGPKHPENEKPE